MSKKTKLELGVSPSGRIHIVLDLKDRVLDSGQADPEAHELERAFKRCGEEGVFLLGAGKVDSGISASCLFWRDFASIYLRELCQVPESGESSFPTIEPPAQPLSELLDRAPPMQGGEYLDAELLAAVWRHLDDHVRERASKFKGGLASFLNRHASRWQGVGRVFFHLAENKRTPDTPFAFLATYADGLSSTDRVQHQPLAKALTEYAGAKNKKALQRILSPVHEAAKSSSVVKELVESNGIFGPIAWTSRQAFLFLQEVSRIEEAGLVVRLPDWWKKRSRPKLQVTVGEKRKGHLGADAILDFKVRAVLGDQKLTRKELQELLDSQEGLVSLRGQWVEVDQQKLQDALDHWKRVEEVAEDGVDFLQGMRLLSGMPSELDSEDADTNKISEWTSIQPGEELRQLLERLRDPSQLEPISTGRSLHATLRPYQEQGVRWLQFLTELGLGACLADDMGLGKTIQVIALLLSIKSKKTSKSEASVESQKTRPSLLVLPASLLSNWKSELERFAPSLRTLYVHPSLAKKEELRRISVSPEKSLQNTDIVLTTYSMLRRQAWLGEQHWRLVVLDESQAIKNPGSAQTRYVKQLRGDARIAMTGTPIENRLSDLWSLFDFLLPGLLGSQRRFKTLVKDIEKSEHPDFRPLRQLVSPYILRRLKTDRRIIADLPEKTEMNAYCGLTKQQTALYTATVREMAETIKRSDGIQRRGLVLSYLMRFKMLCNHPSQARGDHTYEPNESSKFRRLAEICEEIASRQERVLVFTQFREITDPLAEYMAKLFGRPGLVLHGGTPVAKRKRLVDTFQSDDGPPFFVLSIKAGGTGLNLTAASHVVHFDRWWNPAVEDQATDRAFRIGQKKNVLVHKFVCQGTIEEKIDNMIREKRKLAGNILQGGSEQLLTEMSNEELIDMVSLNVDRITI